MDIGYNGHPYIWCNHRKDGARIKKTLDRGLVNIKLLERMPETIITHLPLVGSGHCPLLMEMSDINF